MESFNNVFVSVIRIYKTIKTIVSGRKKVPLFYKEVQRVKVKRKSKFEKSRKHSKFLPEIKMAGNAVNRLVANKKRQYYTNKSRTISTKAISSVT